MTVGDVAYEALGQLQAATLGTVVAVWRSGEVSSHRHLGFRHRTLSDGTREAPITSFVKDSQLLSVWDIQARIERCLASPRRA